MSTSKIYKYIGYNGVITSKVLIDTPNKIEMIELKAGKGKFLTRQSFLCPFFSGLCRTSKIASSS